MPAGPAAARPRAIPGVTCKPAAGFGRSNADGLPENALNWGRGALCRHAGRELACDEDQRGRRRTRRAGFCPSAAVKTYFLDSCLARIGLVQNRRQRRVRADHSKSLCGACLPDPDHRLISRERCDWVRWEMGGAPRAHRRSMRVAFLVGDQERARRMPRAGGSCRSGLPGCQ